MKVYLGCATELVGINVRDKEVRTRTVYRDNPFIGPGGCGDYYWYLATWWDAYTAALAEAKRARGVE